MNNGGSAFPAVDNDFYERGMTLRDYFAGQAIVGLLARCGDTYVDRKVAASLAEQCDNIADAMIAQRERDAKEDVEK